MKSHLWCITFTQKVQSGEQNQQFEHKIEISLPRANFWIRENKKLFLGHSKGQQKMKIVEPHVNAHTIGIEEHVCIQIARF